MIKKDKQRPIKEREREKERDRDKEKERDGERESSKSFRSDDGLYEHEEEGDEDDHYEYEAKDRDHGSLADLLKKIVSTGMGAASLTEEVIKGLLTDLPDRKDVLEKILMNAKTTKEDIISSIGQTVGESIKKIDFAKEVDKILNTYDVEVTAQFKFKKKSHNNKDQ
jgi:hypothetical protein